MRGNDIKEKIAHRKCVLWSMDVKALYPSIDIDFAVKKCVEMMVKNISLLRIV